jgi:hypothetical protein
LRVDEATRPAEQDRDPQERSASAAEVSETGRISCAREIRRTIEKSRAKDRELDSQRAASNLEQFTPYMELLESTFGETVRADLDRYSLSLQDGRRRMRRIGPWIVLPVCFIVTVVVYIPVFSALTLRLFAPATSTELAIAIGASVVELFAVLALLVITLVAIALILLAIFAFMNSEIKVVKFVRRWFDISDDSLKLWLGSAIQKSGRIFYILLGIFAIGLIGIEVIYPPRSHSLSEALLYNFINLYAAAVVGYVLGGWIAGFTVFRRANRKWIPADTAAFGQVCLILSSGRELSRSFKVRQRLMSQLTSLSWAFRSQIPRQLGVSSDGSDLSYPGFIRIANDISALRTWVAFPQPATAEAFCARIALVGGALASNMYHILQFSEQYEMPTKKVRLRSRILSFTRNVAWGSLPAAALVIVSLWGIPISPEIKASWTILSIIWLVVSILASQPDFKERLAASKDVFSLIGPGKKA